MSYLKDVINASSQILRLQIEALEVVSPGGLDGQHAPIVERGGELLHLRPDQLRAPVVLRPEVAGAAAIGWRDTSVEIERLLSDHIVERRRDPRCAEHDDACGSMPQHAGVQERTNLPRTHGDDGRIDAQIATEHP